MADALYPQPFNGRPDRHAGHRRPAILQRHHRYNGGLCSGRSTDIPAGAGHRVWRQPGHYGDGLDGGLVRFQAENWGCRPSRYFPGRHAADVRAGALAKPGSRTGRIWRHFPGYRIHAGRHAGLYRYGDARPFSSGYAGWASAVAGPGYPDYPGHPVLQCRRRHCHDRAQRWRDQFSPGGRHGHWDGCRHHDYRGCCRTGKLAGSPAHRVLAYDFQCLYRARRVIAPGPLCLGPRRRVAARDHRFARAGAGGFSHLVQCRCPAGRAAAGPAVRPPDGGAGTRAQHQPGPQARPSTDQGTGGGDGRIGSHIERPVR